VANTSRGEVAVFRTATTGEPLVDLDHGSPGYGFIPVGTLPSDLKATRDGCRVISANAGSCDLAIIDVPGALKVASGELTVPSGGVVSRVIPRTAAGPLRAAPQEVVVVPASESGKLPAAACPTPGKYRAYVTFPRCQLVAEMDLATGMILQGILVGPDGFRMTKDPVCPVDCILRGETRRVEAGIRDGAAADAPRTLDAPVRPDVPATDRGTTNDGLRADRFGAPPDAPRPPDRGGPRVDAGAPPDAGAPSASGALPHGLALSEVGDRLFVSSAGAGFVTALDVNPATGALENPRRIALAGGVTTTRIQLSPQTRRLGRFLYAIAGDRTVRVISADLERECETNLDLLQVKSADGGVPADQARCYVVGAPETPPRRVGVDRHGLTFGSQVPQDVIFVKSHAALPEAGVPDAGPPATPLRGVFAVVVVSGGDSYVVDVEDWNFVGPDGGGVPPLHLPHRIRNLLQGTASGVPDASVVSVSGAGSGGVPVVVSQDVPEDPTKKASLPGEGVFLRAPGEEVAKDWQLVYEGRLVGRWSGGVNVTSDRLTLADPAGSFCRAGVLPRQLDSGRPLRHGDILALVGCKDDTECGLEQVCTKPVARQVDFGLCLDKSRAGDLFPQCADFLRAAREFVVTRATDDTLDLDLVAVEPQKIIRQSDQPEGGCCSNGECKNAKCSPRFLCAVDNTGAGRTADQTLKRGDCFRPGCESDADCGTGTGFCRAPLDGSPPICVASPLPLEIRGECQPGRDDGCKPQRATGAPCTDDHSCGDPMLECVQSITDAGKQCVDKKMVCSTFAGLSGKCVRKSPCFVELQRYDVLAGRSFLLGGYRRIIPDPKSGECQPSDEKSPLLVERIPVGLPVYPVVLGPACEKTVPPLELPVPNPCVERIPSGYGGYTDKTSAGGVTFMEYGPSTVVHYGNPDIWLTVGLSHLQALPAGSATVDGGVSGLTYAPMPERGLSIQLSVGSGYSRFRVPTSSKVSLPVRLVDAPDENVYVVGMGDQAGSAGSRGQVVRMSRATAVVDTFLVR
jgi:hypothetical protein